MVVAVAAAAELVAASAPAVVSVSLNAQWLDASTRLSATTAYRQKYITGSTGCSKKWHKVYSNIFCKKYIIA